MNHAPVSVLLIALTSITIIPLITLFGYHVRLICLNLTTVEQVSHAFFPANRFVLNPILEKFLEFTNADRLIFSSYFFFLDPNLNYQVI